MATPTFTKTGDKAVTAAKLAREIFGLDISSHELVKQAYEAHLANGRMSNAKTLRRGEVRGGGKKPWRQKGTGRARFGSSRVPIWRGGGITFGPTGDQNHTQSLPVKAKRQAIKQALSLASQANKIGVIETLEFKGAKVAEIVKLLKKIGASGRVLLVVSNKDEKVERATRNVPGLKAVQATYLNVFDVMNADHVLISQDSLEIINKWLVGDK